MSLKSEKLFVDGLTAGILQVQGHVTQKLGKISQIRPEQIEILWSSLRIDGHLPAPIVNGGGDRTWKVQSSDLQKPRDLDLDLGSGHTAYVVHQSSISILINKTYNYNWRTWCKAVSNKQHAINSYVHYQGERPLLQKLLSHQDSATSKQRKTIHLQDLLHMEDCIVCALNVKHAFSITKNKPTAYNYLNGTAHKTAQYVKNFLHEYVLWILINGKLVYKRWRRKLQQLSLW